MKLASLRHASPDGQLVVVDRDLTTCVAVPDIARTLRDVLDTWDTVRDALQSVSESLNSGRASGAQPFATSEALAPLPRAYGWIDGTSYLSHMKRARALRGAELPADFAQEPLMTERVSCFLGCNDPLPLRDATVDMDIEGEVGVILGDVACGASVDEAASRIRLVTLINDVSLRSVLAQTVLRGRSATLFAKPYPTMAPVAVTVDELGDSWRGGLLSLPLRCLLNDQVLAEPNGGCDASFSFPQLISYSATYKPLPAGTVLAAGTLSNEDDDRGGACIAERRLIEQKRTGKALTPYLAVGDTLTIEMRDSLGKSLFGAIHQRIVAA